MTDSTSGAGVMSIDGVDVMALLDAVGPFFEPLAGAFTDATEEDWAAARRVDPDAFGPGGEWVLAFRAFVVRGPGVRTTLVDAGVGHAASPAASWAPVPGRLMDQLDPFGIAVSDIDDVVVTHLHADHYGWTVDPTGTPMFPNARYLVQGVELDAVAPGDPAYAYVVEPLKASGRLAVLDGATSLGRSPTGVHVHAIPTPGHTAGHQSVVVDGHDRRMFVGGDLAVHAVQLANPEVRYRYEHDADQAARTRRTLLSAEQAPGRRVVLATAHLSIPFLDTSTIR